MANPRHGQRIGHDVRRHARLQRRTHHFTVEQAEHIRQIQPAFVSPQIGVGYPELIGRVRREVTLQQVRRHRQVVLRVRRDLEMPLVLRLDAFSWLSIPDDIYSPISCDCFLYNVLSVRFTRSPHGEGFTDTHGEHLKCCTLKAKSRPLL